VFHLQVHSIIISATAGIRDARDSRRQGYGGPPKLYAKAEDHEDREELRMT